MEVVMEDMQRPEGALLSQLRAVHPSRPSMRKAAGWARLSEARWRQIENGYASTNGQKVPVEAPAETLAAMVATLQGTPDDLRRVGREDAALAMEHPRIESGFDDDRPPITLDELRRLDDSMLVRELERRLAERLGGGFREQAQAAPMNPAGGSPAYEGVVHLTTGSGKTHAIASAAEGRERGLDEVTPPSRGDLSPEARPDLYVDEAAQHRERTVRESDASGGGQA